MTDTYYIDPKTRALTIDKDPDETLDYPFDWTEYLDDIQDTIAQVGPGVVPVIFTVSGVEIDSQQNDTKIATVWIKGGVVGATGKVSCRIKTVGGRTIERSIAIKIKDR